MVKILESFPIFHPFLKTIEVIAYLSLVI